ncbi:MAG TPA: DUF4350 domain-containing protein [Gemmatimonadaceae bacterium]|nr:DUF4350 domain-containing protein [Gemmatimonadaceae bacterium]
MGNFWRWLLRPQIVLPVAFVVILVTVVNTPEPRSARTHTYLSTRSTDAGGAQGLFEVTQRLGWRAEQLGQAYSDSMDARAVYAVLDPPYGISAEESAHLLDAVRRGAGLLIVPPNRFMIGTTGDRALADSLRIGASFPVSGRAAPGPDARPLDGGLAPNDLPNRYLAVVRDTVLPSVDTLPHHPGDTVFVALLARTRPDSTQEEKTVPSVLGFPYGRGRIVMVADADLLRNGSLRRGAPAVLAVRMLEWLSPSGSRRLVFDEYHYGLHLNAEPTGPLAVMYDALAHTPAGRTTLQLLAAGLVLLLALGVRAIRPREQGVVERRSPVEHVGALASAYQQVDATRTATRLLVRGLRRRRHAAALATQDDDAYLEALAVRYPQVRDDVARLRSALDAPVSTSELAALGHSIDHIDRILER